MNLKFANSLEMLTSDGKYNHIAYLLADENAVSIKVAKYAGTNKIDLIENEEYGCCSLIKVAHKFLDKISIENTTKAKITSRKRIDNPEATLKSIADRLFFCRAKSTAPPCRDKSDYRKP